MRKRWHSVRGHALRAVSPSETSTYTKSCSLATWERVNQTYFRGTTKVYSQGWRALLVSNFWQNILHLVMEPPLKLKFGTRPAVSDTDASLQATTGKQSGLSWFLISVTETPSPILTTGCSSWGTTLMRRYRSVWWQTRWTWLTKDKWHQRRLKNL